MIQFNLPKVSAPFEEFRSCDFVELAFSKHFSALTGHRWPAGAALPKQRRDWCDDKLALRGFSPGAAFAQGYGVPGKSALLTQVSCRSEPDMTKGE